MNKKGFTLVEIMVVLAILIVMVLIVGAFTSVGTDKGDLLDGATEVKDLIRRAEWQSMHGKNDDNWSVHLETTKAVLFKGISYNASDPDNYEVEIPNSIEISSISLTGGGSDVIFDDEFGNTSTDGLLTISSTNISDTRTININSVGMIDLD
ncbi:MAG: prepilin-type N-terminal cleavage/methylation domain-containing protein [Patescibacteria group bacterium]